MHTKGFINPLRCIYYLIMKTLYNYINKYLYRARICTDSHIHLFDHQQNIFDKYEPKSIFKKFVGFIGVDFNNVDKYGTKDIVSYYDNFISDNQNYNVILLAGGIDANAIIQTYESHKDIIKGFGELLCYDRYDDIELSFKNIDWVEKVFEYNTNNLPVFIHYSLTSDEHYDAIDGLISKYCNTPVVLCHCGLPSIHEGNYKKDYNTIFNRFLKLQMKHQNVYTDVCDSAFTYLRKNPNELFKLDMSRTMIGTDITPNHFEGSADEVAKRLRKSLSKFKKWYKYIDNEAVIKRLFNI